MLPPGSLIAVRALSKIFRIASSSSTLAKKAEDVGSLQPDEPFGETAVSSNPVADVLRINSPQFGGDKLHGRPMEAERAVLGDADVLVWNVAKEDGAC